MASTSPRVGSCYSYYLGPRNYLLVRPERSIGCWASWAPYGGALSCSLSSARAVFRSRTSSKPASVGSIRPQFHFSCHPPASHQRAQWCWLVRRHLHQVSQLVFWTYHPNLSLTRKSPSQKMVVLVGRFRKPKSPVVLGSPAEDEVVPLQTPATPQHITPPVLRNFSYPTAIAVGAQPVPFPSSIREGQSTWDQLGEICNFSPDSVSRVGQARTAGLEDPFFFKSDRALYTRLEDRDDSLSSSSQSIQALDSTSPLQQEPRAKRHRRSALLGLSTSQVQISSSRL
ncbi:hypothetical protein GGR56DRAFT_207151 [Xylariaceae sp. FL0804]|nr:hypothetical protein GGR56DRAFT_207151 [Xylariaceae sp. FL0804]